MADPSPLDTDERLREEKSRAAAWVESKWAPGQGHCPVCQSTAWAVGDLVQLNQLVRTGYPLTAEVFPMFPYTCLVCGYTLLFNALISGIIERPNTDAYGHPLPEASGD